MKKRVLVTGHTGFKGAWLALWLQKLGAEVHGFALAERPAQAPDSALGIKDALASEELADLRDFEAVSRCVSRVKPEVVFHLAAQSLVLESYRHPLDTVATNVMGTAHLLESLRVAALPVACVVVTSDKCYENEGAGKPFPENAPMGGHDLYSASKGACELLVAAFRRSFFDAGLEGARSRRRARATSSEAVITPQKGSCPTACAPRWPDARSKSETRTRSAPGSTCSSLCPDISSLRAGSRALTPRSSARPGTSALRPRIRSR